MFNLVTRLYQYSADILSISAQNVIEIIIKKVFYVRIRNARINVRVNAGKIAFFRNYFF